MGNYLSTNSFASLAKVVEFKPDYVDFLSFFIVFLLVSKSLIFGFYGLDQ